MKLFRTLLFYKYIPLETAEEFAKAHLIFCKSIGIKGRIIVADEGINGTVSGTIEQTDLYISHMRGDPKFADMVFKEDEEEKNSFVKMHVRYKREIVHFGKPEVNVWQHSGNYLEPEEWVKEKDSNEVIVLDVRNEVEWKTGKFKNAVTLPIRHFRELPEHLSELEKHKYKKVLAYCTGGIRCEKATAFLKEQGFKNVFHLHGGIIEYGKKTGGKDFDGKCYVFDNRITVDVNSVNPSVISACHQCGTPTARMVNCANPECNNHFHQCESCGWEWKGCCSKECQEHPLKRKYDGLGFYQKGLNI